MSDDTHLIEKRIDGERVFTGRMLKLEIDRVRLADGAEAEREVIRHPGAAVIVPITESGGVLLVRQYRYPVAAVLLELPAGKLDAGEEPRLCADRELAEETGFRARHIERLGEMLPAPGYTDERMFLFLARDLVPDHEAVGDEDERIDCIEMSFVEAWAAVLSGEIIDGKSIAALSLAKAKLAL